MTVAYDQFSASTISANGDNDWTHTPVGTPRGVIVLVAGAGGADTVTSVTYGGVAMSEMTGSPNIKAASEAGAVHAFFLGASVPTGAQTVRVTTNSTGNRRGYAITLTAGGDTEIIDSDATINSNSQSNPSVTLSLTGKDCFCAISFFSGTGTAGISPLANWTSRDEAAPPLSSVACYTYDIVGSTDVTAGWSQSADDAVGFCVAVSEVVNVATAYTFTGPASGTVNVASTNFTVTPNGTSTAEVTPASDGSGSFTPSSVTFDGTAAAKTFTYTPTDTAGSPHALSVTNDGGLTDPDDLEYTVNAAGGSLPPRRRNQIRKFLQRG